MRPARRHRREPAQREARQRTAILHQLALALHDMDRHRGLTIFKGGEVLRARHRNGGVTRDHFLHQATHSFQPQRQRNHVQQQHFAVRLVADEDIRLNRRANGDDLIRVDCRQRRTTKKFAHAFAHQWHTGGAADHHHFQHLLRLNARIFQCAATGHQSTFN